MIKDVVVKKLKVHSDDRGFFCELIKSSDNFFKDRFGQLSHSKVEKGVVKAWHLHYKQTDWIYVVDGKLKLVLHDLRKKSSTYQKTTEIVLDQKNRQVVKIPPGIAHGYRVIQGPTHIIYLMNREYDPSDELRIPHNDPQINYDWNL